MDEIPGNTEKKGLDERYNGFLYHDNNMYSIRIY
jgi:hypothetical protein